jgi:hypothetical protein
VEVASDASSTVVVPRNVAVTSETYAEVNVITVVLNSGFGRVMSKNPTR